MIDFPFIVLQHFIIVWGILILIIFPVYLTFKLIFD